MTRLQLVDRVEEATSASTPVEDALASELFASDREAGVACFVDADEDFDEDI